jgi:hypothetical protein
MGCSQRRSLALAGRVKTFIPDTPVRLKNNIKIKNNQPDKLQEACNCCSHPDNRHLCSLNRRSGIYLRLNNYIYALFHCFT